MSSFVLILILKTKNLTPKSVTPASIKDAHHSFLNYKHFKKLKNVINHKKILHSQWISLYTYTQICTLYKSISYTITALLFRLSTYENIQSSGFCHLLIMCENKLLSYCRNKTVIVKQLYIANNNYELIYIMFTSLKHKNTVYLKQKPSQMKEGWFLL